MMSALQLENLFYPAVVSLTAALQLARFTRRVGEARGRYKIPIPKTDGDPNFSRIFRAHQNTLEFHPIFITLLWISSLFFHQELSSVLGVVYLYARYKYFYGYAKSCEKRLAGLRIAMNVLMTLLIFCVIGLAMVGFTKYSGREIDLSKLHDKLHEYIKGPLYSLQRRCTNLSKNIMPFIDSITSQTLQAFQFVRTFFTNFLTSFQLSEMSKPEDL
ncbi:microsomal glutathione S-transferase 2-like [Xenia sp. Carnegie-2017]|uniref:microsomal glutathione S-transferase 2-like n=1 Tax=Xenia sp. Carnegie-2017 TaxID=2897299 RepID=UPI001F04A403|nr:microsomal glutathione S-transferase 2-like [Xenia sp. Carnegie-2017]